MCESISKKGFTLVELLTTMLVVGILLALLVPALTAVQKVAVNVKQKAQFHTIELGLEAFRNDIGEYPPSTYSGSYGSYTASERLAEALIGKDGLGFHSESIFFQTGWALGKPLYRTDSQFDTYYPSQTDKDDNLNARRGPYLKLESANAVKLGAIYTPTALGLLSPNSFVLVDMFGKVKNVITGKQIGMPILYYRADKTRVGHSATPLTEMPKSTYDAGDSLFTLSYDNYKGIASLDVPFTGSGTVHPLETDPQWFYNATANPNFTSPRRPYRSESFILRSAGRDGLYGTVDDVFNFNSDK